jgi:uncharacterized membrane protein YjfL (UPF0719 family)
MGTLILQALAYTGVGLIILIIGFFVLDLLTPGHLATEVVQGNKSAGVLAAVELMSLGLILWFAIYFNGGGWGALDDAAVFGLLGVAAQAASFKLIDLATPGHLAVHSWGDRDSHHRVTAAATWAAGAQVAVSLIVCAALT